MLLFTSSHIVPWMKPGTLGPCYMLLLSILLHYFSNKSKLYIWHPDVLMLSFSLTCFTEVRGQGQPPDLLAKLVHCFHKALSFKRAVKL